MNITNSFLHLGKRIIRRTGKALMDTADWIPAKEKMAPHQQNLLQRNAVLKDLHKGRRCFVIATGPSVKSQELAPLANEITFVMSGFWQHPVVQVWQPTYYCISDPLYFDGSEPMRKFFCNLRSRIRDSIFFVPIFSRDTVREQDLLPEEQIRWVAFRGELGRGQLSDIDFTHFVPSAMTVSQLCLMTAIYMGCTPIYLLGFDHDWLSHRGTYRHFYEGLGGLEEHSEVRPELKDHSYKVVMECALVIWRGYESLLALARRKGIRIFDATNGGFLDVFEPADYEQLVSGRSVESEQNQKTVTTARLLV